MRTDSMGKCIALAGLLLLGGCDRLSGTLPPESAAQETRAGLADYQAGRFEEARDAWLRSAESGNAEAAYYLGVMANEGHGGDAVEALRWFEEAAGKGHAKAQYNLALAYERGVGTTRDRAKALDWLARAAESDGDAQYMLGLLLLDEAGEPPDPAKLRKALEWMRKAAEAGNARSAYQLGNIYREGTLVDADPQAAMRWFERALAGGMVESLRPLIDLREVLDDLDKRDVASLRRDAQQGDARAQHVLATRLFRGLGVERDGEEGRRWLEKAAANGDLAARYDLGLILYQGEVADPQAGMALIRKAAEGHFPKAQYAVAKTHAEGIGVERDEAAAVAWYRLAAEQGLPEAEYAMGFSYSEGSGVQRDDAEAMRWFKRAAGHGHAEAAFRVGTMYANGEGVAKNPEEERRWQCRGLVLGSNRAAEGLARHGGFDKACAAYAEDLSRFAVEVLGGGRGTDAGAGAPAPAVR